MSLDENKLHDLSNRIQDCERIMNKILKNEEEIDPVALGYLWHIQNSLISIRHAAEKAKGANMEGAVSKLIKSINQELKERDGSDDGR